jgi:hypothetical protein
MKKVKAKDVRSIIRATFPNYRKRDVYLVPGTKVGFYNLNWEGGSRSVYRACTIEGQPLVGGGQMNAPAPWANAYEGLEVDLPKGAIIVEGGHFCGKESALRIHVHPENMPKLITS